MKLTLLGSGPSSGVPGIGIGWGKCDPKNPRNRRSRQSVLVETGGVRILVDTSPDLRQQFLDNAVETVDAVLYTHAHADHLHGLDDLRGVNKANGKPLPVFADPATNRQIRERFSYALEPLGPNDPGYFVRPVLEMTEFSPGDAIDVMGVSVGTFEQDHGYSKTVGFRFGGIAYSTDVRDLDERAFEAVAGIDVWIIGVFSWKEHWTHAHVDKALGWIERVKPRLAILTHLGTGIDHGELTAYLPDGVFAAHDGMAVAVGRAKGDEGGDVKLLG